MTEGGLKDLKKLEREVHELRNKAEAVATEIRNLYTIEDDVEDLHAHTSLAFARASLKDVSQDLTRIVEALEKAYNLEKELMSTSDGLFSSFSTPWVSEDALTEAMKLELKVSEQIIAKHTTSTNVGDSDSPVEDSEEWHEAFLLLEALRIHSRARLIEQNKFMQEIGIIDESGSHTAYFLECLQTLKEQTSEN